MIELLKKKICIPLLALTFCFSWALLAETKSNEKVSQHPLASPPQKKETKKKIKKKKRSTTHKKQNRKKSRLKKLKKKKQPKVSVLFLLTTSIGCLLVIASFSITKSIAFIKKRNRDKLLLQLAKNLAPPITNAPPPLYNFQGGLNNICFLDVIIQSFLSLKSFREYLKKLPSENSPTSSPSTSQLIKYLTQSQSQKDSIQIVKEILKAMHKINPSFVMGKTGNVKDALKTLLKTMEEKGIKKNKTTLSYTYSKSNPLAKGVEENAIKKLASPTTNAVKDLFTFVFKAENTCIYCEGVHCSISSKHILEDDWNPLFNLNFNVLTLEQSEETSKKTIAIHHLPLNFQNFPIIGHIKEHLFAQIGIKKWETKNIKYFLGYITGEKQWEKFDWKDEFAFGHVEFSKSKSPYFIVAFGTTEELDILKTMLTQSVINQLQKTSLHQFNMSNRVLSNLINNKDYKNLIKTDISDHYHTKQCKKKHLSLYHLNYTMVRSPKVLIIQNTLIGIEHPLIGGKRHEKNYPFKITIAGRIYKLKSLIYHRSSNNHYYVDIYYDESGWWRANDLTRKGRCKIKHKDPIESEDVQLAFYERIDN